MLYTRNAYFFRRWFQREEARNFDRSVDVNFINTFHPEKKRREKGFSNLVYGSRKDIGGFLRSTSLNVAADQQALYELIQNADDSGSSFFSVNYDEKYLLCINNGNYFSEGNMSAIINVGESDKHGEDIGTFGIGFKILHRLLGEDDGLSAIVDNYAGPILFSWNNFYQFEKLVSGEDVKVGFDKEKDSENPWLVKIVYTCFPTCLNEKLKLKDFDTTSVLFDEDELKEMRDFLTKSLSNVDLSKTNYLKNGSIFFLKLGKGKYKFINDNIEKLRSGISYSFNFLNHLKKIYINGSEIKKQQLSQSIDGCIKIGSSEFNEISPRNKDRDIKFRFIYFNNYKDSKKLIQAPNLFNFFSMDEEKNGFRFLLHCNAFDMNNDRRKLQPDSQINERLLPVLSKYVLDYLEEKRMTALDSFLSLYSSLLLSNEPVGKPNINDYFFIQIKEYLLRHIPCNDGFGDNNENTKIKAIEYNVNLENVGLTDLHWFYWTKKDDEELLEAAENKYGIERWDIKAVVINADPQRLDTWIESLSQNNYSLFFNDLTSGYLKKELLEHLPRVKLFKFSDGKYYSIEQVYDNSDLVFLSSKTSRIQDDLKVLNFIVSEENISNYEFTAKITDKFKEDKNIFEAIAIRTSEPNNLTATQKKNLFKNFVNPSTKFSDVGTESLKHLELFCNSEGKIASLEELISATLPTPQWLNSYKISHDEYFEGLNKYLMQEVELYEKLLLAQWDVIIDNVSEIKELYESALKYFELSENNSPFTDQKVVFIKQPDAEKKFVTSDKVFFNPSLIESRNYAGLQTAIFTLTGFYTPAKEITQFFEVPPFRLASQDFCDLSIEEAVLDPPDIEALIESCIENRENFFEHYFLEQSGKQILVSPRDNETYQVSPNKEAISFLKNNSDSDEVAIKQFKILPYSFTKYNKEQGVLIGEDFYNKLVDSLNVDFYRNQLIDVISYSEPKQKFLLSLSEVSLNPAEAYTQDSFEYKVLDIAIKELTKPELKERFRSKLTVRVNDSDVGVLNIQSIGEITFGNQIVLKTAEVLPNSFQNSDELVNIVKSLTSAGLPEQQLKELFGIRSELDHNNVLDQIGLEIITGQQLLYLGLLGETTEIDWSEYSFQLSDDEKLNVFRFLHSLYGKSRSAFSSKDWHVLMQVTDHDPLRFDPQQCVLPPEYSLEAERLPDFIATWIADTEGVVQFINDLGINTSSSFIVELRKHFQDSGKISVSNIAQYRNEELLFNTLRWIKEKGIVIESDVKFKAFEEIVKTINRIREDNGKRELVIETEIDFGKLKSDSKEWTENSYINWKEELEEKYSIFLYDGSIPKLISLDEIEDYTNRKFNDGEIAINNDNKIYINSSEIHRIQGLLNTLVEGDQMEESDWRKLIIRMGGLHSGDSDITDEDRSLLAAVKEIGKPKIIELIELQKQLGNKDISKILAVGQQAFSNDGALFNSGYEGERIVYSDLKKRFSPERVRWTSAENPENSNGTDEYDFEILDNKKEKVILYVDAKSTTSKKYQTDKTEIYWRNSEWRFIEETANSNYLIARVFNVNSDNPEIVYLKVSHDKNSA